MSALLGGRGSGAEELRRACAPARALGLSWVKITGGEPFVRPDVLDVIDALRAEELEIDVETNGTLVDEQAADRLARAEVRRVSVSLDGASAATHDDLRGQPGAFDRARAAIARLTARGLAVEVLFTLTRRSEPELDAALDLGAALGVDAFKVNFLTPMGRAEELFAGGGAVPVGRILDLARRLEEERAPALPFALSTSLPMAFVSRRQLREGRAHRCPILNLLGVLPDGRVSLCGVGLLAPELILGDLRRESVLQVWRESPLLRTLRRDLHAGLQGVCGRCIMRGACLGACRADAYAASRDLLAPFWLCEEAERAGRFPPSRLAPTDRGAGGRPTVA